MALAAAVLLIPLVLLAFILRTVAILAVRNRWPRVADDIDRWWLWAPFVVVLAVFVALLVVLTRAMPPLGIAMALGALFALYRGFFGASSIGSPFRPRRR
jgi:formate-dependent nitrite reductase membrane component NrfD